ncbi:MAG: YdgA family protein [Candidatus Phlomobacter fragariae]
MKKSLVAVSVIVIVAIIWTIGSWYTGRKIEGEFDSFIERTNTTIENNAPEAGINVKTENYQRGIFTSNADIIINIKENKENNEEKNSIVKFATKIFHGPFPISKIVKLNLLPRLASATIEIVKNETTEELFKYTQEQAFITGDVDIGFNEDLDANLNLSPLDGNAYGKNITFSGGTINYVGNTDLKDIKVSVVSDNFVIGNKEKTENMILKGLNIQSNSLLTPFNFYSGKQTLNIADINFNSDEIKFSFKNLEINLDSVLKGDNIDGKISYSINDLMAKEQNLGSGELTLLIERMDAKAFSNFLKNYNDEITHNFANDNPLYNADTIFAQLLIDNLPSLLKNSPRIVIEPFYWKNNAGKSNIKIDIDMKPLRLNQISIYSQNNQYNQIIKALFNHFNINVNLSKPMLIEMLTQTKILNSDDKVTRPEQKTLFSQKATEQISKFESSAKQNVFTSPTEYFLSDEKKAQLNENRAFLSWMLVTKDNMTMDINYAGDELEMNKQKFKLEQFLINIGLIDNPSFQPPATPKTIPQSN